MIWPPRQKLSNFFVAILVQTMTPRRHFEIIWPLADKRHSKVGTRPEAFHNVCQNWPFFRTLLKPNRASNMNRTRKCLINLIIHSMWILLFAFWKTFDILKSFIKPHTCWSCSSILFSFYQNVMYSALSRRTFYRLT